MNINEAFPSKFLRAADLKGRNITVTIDKVVGEDMGQDGGVKPVVYFQGKDKGLVLNKTNANVIADRYGPETDGWTGETIVIYPDRVAFKGQMTDAIRVRVPFPQGEDDGDLPDF